MNEYMNILNCTDLKVLEVLNRYSEEYGAAHIKHATIEKEIGKSNATVRRSLRKLESLHMIERTHYVRPVMSRLGANIYAIKPFEYTREFNNTNGSEQLAIYKFVKIW